MLQCYCSASSANPQYIKALTKKSKPVAVKAGKSIAAVKLIKLQNGCVLVPKDHFMGFKAYKKVEGSKNISVNANTGKVTVKVHLASIYEDAAGKQKVVDCFIKVK